MARYAAAVEDGIVVQVLVVADGKAGDATIKQADLAEESGVHPGIGWLWDGSTFTDPNAAADEEV